MKFATTFALIGAAAAADFDFGGAHSQAAQAALQMNSLVNDAITGRFLKAHQDSVLTVKNLFRLPKSSRRRLLEEPVLDPVVDPTNGILECATCVEDYLKAGGCTDSAVRPGDGCQDCGKAAGDACAGTGVIIENSCVPCEGKRMNGTDICDGGDHSDVCTAQCIQDACAGDDDDDFPTDEDIDKIVDTGCKKVMQDFSAWVKGAGATCMDMMGSPNAARIAQLCDGGNCVMEMKSQIENVKTSCGGGKIGDNLADFMTEMPCAETALDMMCMKDGDTQCMSVMADMEGMMGGPTDEMLDQNCGCFNKMAPIMKDFAMCSGDDQTEGAGMEVMVDFMCKKTGGQYCFPAAVGMMTSMGSMMGGPSEGPPPTKKEVEKNCACLPGLDEMFEGVMQMMGGDEGGDADVGAIVSMIKPGLDMQCIKDTDGEYCSLKPGIWNATQDMFSNVEKPDKVDFEESCSTCAKGMMKAQVKLVTGFMGMLGGAMSGMGDSITGADAVMTDEQKAEADKLAKAQAEQMAKTMQMMEDMMARTFRTMCLERMKDGKKVGYCGEVLKALEKPENVLMSAGLLSCDTTKDTCADTCKTALGEANKVMDNCAGPVLEIALIGLGMAQEQAAGMAESMGVTTMDLNPLTAANAVRGFAEDVCKVSVYKTVGAAKDFGITLTNLKGTFVDDNADVLKDTIISNVAETLGISPSSITDVKFKTGAGGKVEVTVTVEPLSEDDSKVVENKSDFDLNAVEVDLPEEAKVDPTKDVTPEPETRPPTPDGEPVSSAFRAAGSTAVVIALVSALAM